MTSERSAVRRSIGWARGAGLAGLTLMLAACSLQGSERDDSAKTQLDFANNEIVMPMDPYLISEQNQNDMAEVEVRVIEDCLRSKGVQVVPATFDDTLIGDRTYFAWNDEAAKQETQFMAGGEEMEPGGVVPTYEDESQKELREACRSERQSEIDSMTLGSDEASSVSLGANLAQQAAESAAKDGKWFEYKDQWYQCIESRGLTRSGDDWMSAEVAELQGKERSDSAAAEEIVRVSLIESGCSQETGAVQNLADLEASYQVPLIEKNQAELNEQKEKIQERLQKMEEYLAQHG